MTKKQQIEVEGRDLILSNAEKVYFPGNGFTKGDVIAFYSAIADTILPLLARPAVDFEASSGRHRRGSIFTKRTLRSTRRRG